MFFRSDSGLGKLGERSLRALERPRVAEWLKDAPSSAFWAKDSRNDLQPYLTHAMSPRHLATLTLANQKSPYGFNQRLLNEQIALRGRAAQKDPLLKAHFAGRWNGAWNEELAGALCAEAELGGAGTSAEICTAIAARPDFSRDQTEFALRLEKAASALKEGRPIDVDNAARGLQGGMYGEGQPGN